MIIQRKILPGQPGTKKWVKKYGPDLICLRYKYDSEKKLKIKSIEIIVEQSPWVPDTKKIPKNKIVNVQIHYGEIHMGRIVKAAGGKWNRGKKVWELPYGEVLDLGLENRIISK